MMVIGDFVYGHIWRLRLCFFLFVVRISAETLVDKGGVYSRLVVDLAKTVSNKSLPLKLDIPIPHSFNVTLDKNKTPQGQVWIKIKPLHTNSTLHLIVSIKETTCLELEDNLEVVLSQRYKEKKAICNFVCTEERGGAVIRTTLNISGTQTHHLTIDPRVFGRQAVNATVVDIFGSHGFVRIWRENADHETALLKRAKREDSLASQLKFENNCNHKEKCCKVSFNVSIRELGWEDVILSPSHFFVSLCVGTCNEGMVALELGALIIRQLKRAYYESVGMPAGHAAICCVPSSVAKVGIIFINTKNEIRHAQLELMAKSCICI